MKILCLFFLPLVYSVENLNSMLVNKGDSKRRSGSERQVSKGKKGRFAHLKF